MHSRLLEILRQKEMEIERMKKLRSGLLSEEDLLPVRDFKASISAGAGVKLIAEIKFASPSMGRIRERQDPCAIGDMYERAGAAAVSLLTEREFFEGRIEDLPRLKGAVSLPVLRKDFILDEVQIWESRLWGADAVLLIARILTRERLSGLLDVCKACGLTPLTEVHDRSDLEKALSCGADLIGINNRDLDSFEVDVGTTLRLAPLVPKGCVVVSESGIKEGEDLQALKSVSVSAVLVGTGLMGSNDIEAKARELAAAGGAVGQG